MAAVAEVVAAAMPHQTNPMSPVSADPVAQNVVAALAQEPVRVMAVVVVIRDVVSVAVKIHVAVAVAIQCQWVPVRSVNRI